MLPITARVAWITPSTLTWCMRATCSLSYVSSVPCQLMPALFTKMVTGPSSASVRATIASTAAESATSAPTATHRRTRLHRAHAAARTLALQRRNGSWVARPTRRRMVAPMENIEAAAISATSALDLDGKGVMPDDHPLSVADFVLGARPGHALADENERPVGPFEQVQRRRAPRHSRAPTPQWRR